MTAATSDALPLSLSQREVWLDQQAHPGSAHLNIGGCCFLDGPLDRARLAEALERLVAESEALRLLPLPDGGQRLVTWETVALECVELAAAADPAAAIRAWWPAEFARPIPLDGQGRPWRVVLLRAGERRHGVMIKFHHLVMDGWGTSWVFQRWAELYNALAAGETAAQSGDPGYRRFIAESLAYADSEAWGRDAAYWHARLPTLPEPLIETRHGAGLAARHAARHTEGLPPARLHTHLLPRPLYDHLSSGAEALGASVYHLFLAALALYFGRIAGRREVVIGVPSLNRGGRRYKATLGMFVGVSPLTVPLPEGGSVRDLIAAVGGALRGAYRHQRYPLSALGRELQVIRHGRDRLFDVLLSFERQDYAVRFGDAVLGEARQLFSGVARYPLAVTVCEFHPDQPVEMVLEAAADCFAEGEPELLGQRLHHLAARMAADPDAPLASLTLLPEEERRELVEGLHAEVPHHHVTTPFVTAFEHQATLRPEATALLWEAGRLDYGELNRRANRLAHHLLAMGLEREGIVAVAMERAPQTVAALLAVAKAGGAFLPLDPDAPTARLADILAQSGAALLLTQQHLGERLAPLHPRTLLLDAADTPLLDATLAEENPPPPAPGELAYVLFTSGSSGRPKGVMIEHAALARRLAWLARNYAITPQDRAGQATQLTFDPALIELFLPLTHGGSVALPPPGRQSAEVVARFAAAFGVTFIAFVPSTLARFLSAAEGLDGLRLRVACCGGEVLPPALAARFARHTGGRLFNVYGPTEATIFATAWECRPADPEAPLPVGRPVDDSRIYVLDDALRPLPTGVAGEIFIGGGALARGYLGRPDLDAESFLPDPFVPGGRLYRSGDRGYWGADGNLHFVGRVDRQLKLRGYRIEPGEIEALLRADPAVRAAAVKAVGTEGRRALHAWIAPQAGEGGVEGLQAALRQRLPDYMLPRAITVLPRLPESASGKIDYAALTPPVAAAEADGARGAVQAPRNALEGHLLRLWEELLPQRPIGIHDNFFECGGDSLAAVGVMAGVDALSGRRNPLSLLIEHPSVAALAAALAGRMGADSLLVTLSDTAGGVPLYLVASGHGDALRLGPLAKALEESCTLHMLQPPVSGSGVACRTIEELAERYAQLILARTQECDGPPPLLAGFSVGGITALETARRLAARGLPPRALVLMDSAYPRWLWRHTVPWRLSAWLVHHLRLQELSLNGRRLGSLFSDPGLTAQVCALRRHRPGPYGGRAELVVSSGLARRKGVLFGPWRRLLGTGLVEHQVTGFHGTIFAPDNVAELAAVLRRAAEAGEG